MRIHLIGATVLGLASAGFAMSPAAFAATNGVGNNTAGMNYNNGSQAYGKQNTRTQSQPNGQQALNQQRNEGWVGSSGNGSAMNNGVQSTQGSQQATNRRNEGWVGSSGNGSAANNGVQSNEQGQNRNTGWTVTPAAMVPRRTPACSRTERPGRRRTATAVGSVPVATDRRKTPV